MQKSLAKNFNMIILRITVQAIMFGLSLMFVGCSPGILTGATVTELQSILQESYEAQVLREGAQCMALPG